MYITILGRQPALGIAELEQIYGSSSVDFFSDQTATVECNDFHLSRLGGTQKAGHIVSELSGDWRKISQKVISQYSNSWANYEGKITLGISAYGFGVEPREVQRTGIVLKQQLKKKGVSLRLIPNGESALSSATSHHNKLGLSDNKIELLIVQGRNNKVIIAESTGAQNITAYTRRDQERPKRDAFVGMLPPKLAQMMINLAGPKDGNRILDPFCGTGVILQEAALMGYPVYGTDLADKMIDFSKVNLEWLRTSHHVDVKATITQGDAMTTSWKAPIDAVVGETYLGQPFSAPPSLSKLAEVRRNCDHIISSFLKNLGDQINPGTPLCIAIPAWKDINNTFTHLTFVGQLNSLGYERVEFKNVADKDLLYFREDQVVARELLVLIKK